MGLDLPLRDVRQTPAYRDELVAATGRTQVPVLRIEEPDGSVRWMPESLDIIAYLESHAEKS
jgi:glutaredoxin 2